MPIGGTGGRYGVRVVPISRSPLFTAMLALEGGEEIQESPCQGKVVQLLDPLYHSAGLVWKGVSSDRLREGGKSSVIPAGAEQFLGSVQQRGMEIAHAPKQL